MIAEQTNQFYNEVNGKAVKGKLEGRSAPGVCKQLEGVKNMLDCVGARNTDTCVKAGTFAYDVLMSAEQGLTAPPHRWRAFAACEALRQTCGGTGVPGVRVGVYCRFVNGTASATRAPCGQSP